MQLASRCLAPAARSTNAGVRVSRRSPTLKGRVAARIRASSERVAPSFQPFGPDAHARHQRPLRGTRTSLPFMRLAICHSRAERSCPIPRSQNHDSSVLGWRDASHTKRQEVRVGPQGRFVSLRLAGGPKAERARWRVAKVAAHKRESNYGTKWHLRPSGRSAAVHFRAAERRQASRQRLVVAP